MVVEVVVVGKVVVVATKVSGNVVKIVK